MALGEKKVQQKLSRASVEVYCKIMKSRAIVGFATEVAN